jgi:sugar phosphate isomerase/epimerase
LRKAAGKADIEIVALHWLLAKTKGLHLTSPDAEVRRKTSAYLAELARFCADLGGGVLVFGSPQQRNLKNGVTQSQGLQYATEVFGRVLPVLERTGVRLALEPLGPGTTNFMVYASDTMELVRKINSPHCQLLLDCKASVKDTEPIPVLIRKYAEHLIHFHANDANRLGPGMGDLVFDPIFQALRDVDFRGWVSVEVFDTSPGAENIARKSLQYMQAVEARIQKN